MQNNSQKQALQSRLKAFFDAVYDEAIQNPAFFSRIESILVSKEAKLSPEKKPASFSSRQSPNILEILHTQGEDELRHFLSDLTTSELSKLCTSEGIKKNKESKEIDREQVIELLFLSAKNRLKQGESFTKS